MNKTTGDWCGMSVRHGGASCRVGNLKQAVLFLVISLVVLSCFIANKT